MYPVRLVLLAVLAGVLVCACSRGPQGDPADAAPVRQLISRLDADIGKLQHLFELRDEVDHARAQLRASQRELADDFPQIEAAGSLEQANLPAAADGRVHAFRASVSEYDRLVARHNALAKQLGPYLKGRSPQDVQKLLRAMQVLRDQLSGMLKDADYTKAVFVAQHSELVRTLGLQSP